MPSTTFSTTRGRPRSRCFPRATRKRAPAWRGEGLAEARWGAAAARYAAAARRAGIPVIGVEFGYTEVPIADLKPDRVIGQMSDLPAAVESLMPQRNSS